MIGKVLVVGGGVGGMSAALALARRGVEVELVDADPHWRAYGAGISVTGLSLRASPTSASSTRCASEGLSAPASAFAAPTAA